METLVNFVNKYIAEDEEKFSKKELAWAIVVALICCAALIWCCTIDIK